jgi:hypothetical protein
MHFGDGQSWTTARRYIVCFVSVWVCEWGGIHMSSHYHTTDAMNTGVRFYYISFVDVR